MHTLVRHPLRLLFVVALVLGLLPAAAMAQDKPGDIVDIAAGNKDFSTLVTAVKAAGLVDALKAEGPFTVFAPTNEAFAKLPKETLDALLKDPKGALTQILLYHVVSGKVLSSDLKDGAEVKTLQGEPIKVSLKDGKAMINDSNVVKADIEASNGVIHVIDTVLIPPTLAKKAEAAATPEATATPEAKPAEKDIVDTAVAAGDFKTLVAAVQAAGLVDALKAKGPLTVFAPTDAAFAKLPKGTVETLLKDPKGKLTQILLYHVIPGDILAAQVKDGLEAKTLEGSPVKFTVKDGKVFINDAQVVATDIKTSNGVIHVIDSVILPPEKAAAESAAAKPAEAAGTKAASSEAPKQMPVTGGESSPLLPVAVAGLALAALAGAAFVSSKRAA